MKTLVTILMIAAFTVISSASVFAAMDEDVTTQAPKKDIITGTVETVGDAVVGTAETAVSPVTATGRMLAGEDTPDKIVTDPINQGGKTINKAAVDTGETLTGQKE